MGAYQSSNRQAFAPGTPSTGSNAATNAAADLTTLLTDMFALYIKTKAFRWQVLGPHSRYYHRLFDEQAAQILATTGGVAKRVREFGGTTLRLVNHIALILRMDEADADSLSRQEMLAELRDHNQLLCTYMRDTLIRRKNSGDVETTSPLENWIDEAEQRSLFLSAANQDDELWQISLSDHPSQRDARSAKEPASGNGRRSEPVVFLPFERRR